MLMLKNRIDALKRTTEKSQKRINDVQIMKQKAIRNAQNKNEKEEKKIRDAERQQ